jgi:plastocyanin domain-containing protein
LRIFAKLLASALFGFAVAACTAGAEAGELVAKNKHEMSVTLKGFEPANIAVKAGEPATLVITRKTDDTCATEIVIDEPKVNVKLPLNQPVTVTFTPTKTGTLKYGCAMNKMIGGVISVR